METLLELLKGRVVKKMDAYENQLIAQARIQQREYKKKEFIPTNLRGYISEKIIEYQEEQIG